jgi:hypothetical protein
MNPEIESMLQLTVEQLLNEDGVGCDPAALAAALREFAEMIEADIEAGAYAE